MARLLVIEENPTTARVLNLYLSGAGHRVREAETTAEALLAMDTFRPQVIVLSAALPPDSILDLISRGKDWTIRPKVVLTTLRGQEAQCRELVRAGASDYVVKSRYFQNNLIDWVDQALAGKKTEWKLRGPLSLERPLFRYRDRRGRGPQIPVHAAFDRRKKGRSHKPAGDTKRP